MVQFPAIEVNPFWPRAQHDRLFSFCQEHLIVKSSFFKDARLFFTSHSLGQLQLILRNISFALGQILLQIKWNLGLQTSVKLV